MESISVKSGLPQNEDGGFPLAIFDRNDAYKADEKTGSPDGEIYIADGEVHNVPATVEVMRALSDGRLVRADGKEAKDQPALVFPPPQTPDSSAAGSSGSLVESPEGTSGAPASASDKGK